MISVIEIYNTIRDLCNKDQKGFVTPKVFNSFAEVAQEVVFSNMFDGVISAKQVRRANLDSTAGTSALRGVIEDLSTYITDSKLMSLDPELNSEDSNLFYKPEKIAKLISLRVNDSGRTPVELIYEAEKVSYILSSNLSAPTALFPVALVSNYIEVFPVDITSSVMATYYRQPAAIYITSAGEFLRGDVDVSSGPRIVVEGAIDNEGFFAVNVPQSRDFELPEHYKSELISEIAKLIGVRLRDTFLTSYSNEKITAK